MQGRKGTDDEVDYSLRMYEDAYPCGGREKRGLSGRGGHVEANMRQMGERGGGGSRWVNPAIPPQVQLSACKKGWKEEQIA